jgi:hypothetical protein
MTTKQRFESKMRKKNWVITSCEFIPISYSGPQGREGGWEIEFETLDLTDDISFDTDVVFDNEQLITDMPYAHPMCYTLIPGFISAYRKEDVFKIIDMLPVATPITGNVNDSHSNLVNKMI